jgi:hypothetical protein
MAPIRSIFAGNICWVKIRVDGHPVYQSSELQQKQSDAINLRYKLLANVTYRSIPQPS